MHRKIIMIGLGHISIPLAIESEENIKLQGMIPMPLGLDTKY